jgi:BON domain
MTEPLFGAVSSGPMWSGIPPAGFGMPQTPFPFGNVPISLGAQGFGPSQIAGGGMMQGAHPDVLSTPYGFTPQPYGLSGGIAAQPPAIGSGAMGQGFGANVPAVPNVFGTLGGFPQFAGPELTLGVNVPLLVTSIAIRRRQPMGPTNDQEIEDFIYDTFEMLPATSEVEVRCEGGRVTLTGSVPQKRLKRDVGEIAWTIPGVNDVQNNVTIATKRRARSGTRETESQTAATGRKQT